MLCTVIQEKTNEAVLSAISKAKKLGSDLVEIRLDYIRKPNLKLILQRKSLPAVVTARPLWEGGNYKGNEDSRIALLREAVSLGAEYIDVEFKAYKDFNRGNTKLILSYHNFSSIPHNLAVIFDKMAELNPDIIKIAVTPRSIGDVITLAKLQRSISVPATIFPMGELGVSSRILYKRLGGVLTYAAITKDKKTASGQLLLSELINTYRVNDINDSTAIYAIFGNPVSHSRSPIIFNSAFKRDGINAIYVPILIDDISKIKDVIDVLGISGAAVTIPHKEGVIKYLDELDDASSTIGAVNTIVVRDGKLVGYNTDVSAVDIISDTIKCKFGVNPKGKDALVIGAGGTARAIVYRLVESGAIVTIANRTPEQAKMLAEEFGCNYLMLGDVLELNADIVVNATSVGMYPDKDNSPIDRRIFRKNTIVLDCVYTPKKTRFLRDAKKAGATIIYGTDMFIRQASLQYRYFTGKSLSPQILKKWNKLISSSRR